MDAAQLLLIRHAHVETGNDGRRMCGWLDLPLSPSGERQLQRFRAVSSKFRPAAVYASSSLRAVRTAETLASKWSLPISIDPDLREINCGALEGMLLDEVMHRYPELWAQNALQTNDDFAWPEGETYQNFRRRAFTALSRIAGRHTTARVVVVTHAGVIGQVAGSMKGLPAAAWEPYRPAPFTATEVLWNEDAPQQLLSFNVSDWW